MTTDEIESIIWTVVWALVFLFFVWKVFGDD